VLVFSVGVELVFRAGFLYVAPVTRPLDQKPPSLAGFATAAVAGQRC